LKQVCVLGYSELDEAYNVTRALSILVIFLALIVAGREIPEISKLADDTSNDGQIVVMCAEVVPSPVSQRANTASVPITSTAVVVFSRRQDRASRPVLGTTGQDLLLFLKIQRT
jgi:hypothetical protein